MSNVLTDTKSIASASTDLRTGVKRTLQAVQELAAAAEWDFNVDALVYTDHFNASPARIDLITLEQDGRRFSQRMATADDEDLILRKVGDGTETSTVIKVPACLISPKSDFKVELQASMSGKGRAHVSRPLKASQVSGEATLLFQHTDSSSFKLRYHINLPETHSLSSEISQEPEPPRR